MKSKRRVAVTTRWWLGSGVCGFALWLGACGGRSVSDGDASHGASAGIGGGAGNVSVSGAAGAASAGASENGGSASGSAGAGESAGAINGDGGSAGSASGGSSGEDGGLAGEGGGAGEGVGITQIVAGQWHGCVLRSDGGVKCWGQDAYGQLGYGNSQSIGDNELPSSVGLVSVTTSQSVTVKQLTAGSLHTCALLSDASVKCWGDDSSGELGLGDHHNPTFAEQPSTLANLKITNVPGVTVIEVVAGNHHTCARLSDGTATCWGNNTYGQLGYGTNHDVGYEDSPADFGPVKITTNPGVEVTQLALGEVHTCALLSDGTVKCWGDNSGGQLGYGNTDEQHGPPSALAPVSVTTAPGVKVVQLTAGSYHTCVLLSDGSVKCWGDASEGGELGYGNTNTIGDDELPSSVGAVSITNTPGVTVKQLVARGFHTCALLSDGTVNCWGANSQNDFGHEPGELGLGNTANIGDDELPSSVGPISVSTKAGVTVKQIAPGLFDTCALLSDETVKCWGYNHFGELGLGNTTDIGDDELPSSVSAISLF